MSGFAGSARNFQEGQFPVPPAGSHPAVLVGLIDLGEQESDYGGNRTWSRRIYLIWELVNEPIGPNDNHVIGLSCTLSFSSKAKLRGIIEKWRGRLMQEGEEFDPINMLGKACLITVTHSISGEKTFAKWDGLAPLPKGMTHQSAKRKQVCLDNCDSIEEKDLPEWLPYIYGRKVIEVVRDGQRNNRREKSREEVGEDPWTRDQNKAPSRSEAEQDIPF